MPWEIVRDTQSISTPNTFDTEGRLIFGVPYPPEPLTGSGSILGYLVKCICAEWAVRFHTGYEPDEDDYHDVAALCERFHIALPAEFARFADDSA
ncbi:MAG TPA: hypothetical protein VHD63_09850 [Ktedonobacteraceae bacterium]|nr:hypothetical protein [Ktedonobacteraceae bacterium]